MKNAYPIPCHGTERAEIVPSHGTEEAPPVPPHGTIRALFAPLSVPPHGNHLEACHLCLRESVCGLMACDGRNPIPRERRRCGPRSSACARQQAVDGAVDGTPSHLVDDAASHATGTNEHRLEQTGNVAGLLAPDKRHGKQVAILGNSQDTKWRGNQAATLPLERDADSNPITRKAEATC
jgi:hypothetical protein